MIFGILVSLCLIITTIITVNYSQGGNKKYFNCTEDGCVFVKNGQGKFGNKEECQKSCVNSSVNSRNSNSKHFDSRFPEPTPKPTPKPSPKPSHMHSPKPSPKPKDSKFFNDFPKVNQEPPTKKRQPFNSNFLNTLNVDNIKEQIRKKKQNIPYYATTKQANQVVTDHDTFPYPRWYRGQAHSTEPIIMEREAGWRPRHDFSYVNNLEPNLSTDYAFDEGCEDIHDTSNINDGMNTRQTHVCFDANGQVRKYFQCNERDPDCYDDSPTRCGGADGVEETHYCNNFPVGSVHHTFRCIPEPGQDNDCFDDSPTYCPPGANFEQHVCNNFAVLDPRHTFYCNPAISPWCEDDSPTYCNPGVQMSEYVCSPTSPVPGRRYTCPAGSTGCVQDDQTPLFDPTPGADNSFRLPEGAVHCNPSPEASQLCDQSPSCINP